MQKKYKDLLNKFDEANRELSKNTQTFIEHTTEVIEHKKVLDEKISSVNIIISDLDKQFAEKTGIWHLKDQAFLWGAVALQCTRQIIIGTHTERLDDQAAAEKVKGKDEKEKSDRKHRYYNPSLAEIMSSPVPFDANVGANGALSGGGKLGHRATAIGHDPILGLVVGTANIATSTLTTWTMQSYHIKTGLVRTKNNNFRQADVFAERAQTSKVFEVTKNKLLSKELNR